MSRRFSLSSPRREQHSLIANLILFLLAAMFLVPLLWLLFASVDPEAGVTLSPPETLTLRNFSEVMNWELTFLPLLNSLLITGVSAGIVMVLAALAAYPLSRYRLRHKNPFLYTVLFLSALPVTAIMVPVYALFVQINLIDNYLGAILFLAASGMPYAIWMMKNFMDGVPVSLEEAAWIDGASAMQSLVRIVLPLMTPGLLAVTFFQFIIIWGNFFVPFILLFDPDKLPMAVTVYQFFGSHGLVNYGQLAAYSIIYTVPVVVFYILVSRVFSGAFRLGGGTKG